MRADNRPLLLCLAMLVLLLALGFMVVQETPLPKPANRVFTLQMNLNGYTANEQGKNWLKYLFPPSNPDVYFVLKIPGSPPQLIPAVEKQVEGRTVMLSFVAPAYWNRGDFVVEVWKDNAQADASLKKILEAFHLDMNVGGTVGVVLPPIYANTSAGTQLSVGLPSLENVTLIQDEYIGEFRSRWPKSSVVAGNVMATGPAGPGNQVPIGTISIRLEP